MDTNQATLEVFVEGSWQTAAEFHPTDVPRGHKGGGQLVYVPGYAATHFNHAAAALSCLYPVNFIHHQFASTATGFREEDDQRHYGWPPFLLDLIPQGFGRRNLEDRLGLPANGSADWELLLHGAGNPIGNLRIAEAATRLRDRVANGLGENPGFDRSQISGRHEDFVRYAAEHGVLLPGTSGVQGDAPKMLVVLAKNGRWYADGTVPDQDIAGHYLVKMRRGKDDRDALVIRNEAPYMRVAGRFGLQANPGLEFEGTTLFIPRFDRRNVRLDDKSVDVGATSGITRIGQESLTSLAGINEYGKTTPLIDFCKAVATFSTSPQEDVTEFVLRDVLNLAMGNTDNHGRNSAIQRFQNGTIRLSPIFDFAPMFLDPEGVARQYRWTCEREGGLDWNAVLDELRVLPHVDLAALAGALIAFGERIANASAVLFEEGVDQEVIELITPKFAAQIKLLKEIKPWINASRKAPIRP